MNLLFYAPQMASYGGMERHICLLALRCVREGMHVALVTTSNSLNTRLRQELKSGGVDLQELPVERGKATPILKLMWLVMIALCMRLKHWDVIYTNGQSGLASIMWLARDSTTRIIHHHHTSANSDEQRTWNLMFRKTLATAPALVACSDSTRMLLMAAIARDDVIFLPYLTEEIVQASEVHEKKYDRDLNLKFGFIGRLVSTKGIETICLLSQNPQLSMIRWFLYGSGEYPASYFERFPNVQYCGPYKDVHDYARILQELDAVVLFSSHSEGMPLSLIEAMSAGLPWVATDQGGTRELAVSPGNCLVIPRGAGLAEIAKVTVQMVSHLRAGLTSRLRQRQVYDDLLAPDVVATRWLRFLQEKR